MSERPTKKAKSNAPVPMVTPEESNRMIIEATLGRKTTSVPGAHARRYFAVLRAEIEAMKAQGYMPTPHSD